MVDVELLAVKKGKGVRGRTRNLPIAHPVPGCVCGLSTDYELLLRPMEGLRLEPEDIRVQTDSVIRVKGKEKQQAWQPPRSGLDLFHRARDVFTGGLWDLH